MYLSNKKHLGRNVGAFVVGRPRDGPEKRREELGRARGAGSNLPRCMVRGTYTTSEQWRPSEIGGDLAKTAIMDERRLKPINTVARMLALEVLGVGGGACHKKTCRFL